MEKYYKILGLSSNASMEEVKKTYRQLAKRWHPDLFHNNPEEKKQAEEKFREIDEAYKMIRDYSSGTLPKDRFTSATGVRVQKSTPDDHYQKGVEYASDGKDQEAIDEFTLAIRCDPSYLKAYQYRGFILEKLGFNQRANSDFTKVKELQLKDQVNQSQDTSSKKQNSKTSSSTKKSTVSSRPTEASGTKTDKFAQKSPSQVKNSTKSQSFENNPTPDQETVQSKSSNQNPSPSKTSSSWRGEFISNNSQVTAISLNPEGDLLIAGYQNNLIYLWNLNEKKHLATFRGHTGMIRSLLFYSENQKILSGGDDKTIRSRKIDISESVILGSSQDQHTNKITALTLSHNEKILVSGSADKSVKIWYLDSPYPPFSITAFSSAITALDISPDDTQVAIASLDNNVRIRRLEDGKLVSSIAVDSSIASVCFSPDGKYLATGGFNHEIKIWELETRTSIATLIGHQDLVSSVKFSHDSQELISASWDGSLKCWQIKSSEEIETISCHRDAILTMAISRDCNRIVTGSSDQRIGIWNRSG